MTDQDLALLLIILDTSCFDRSKCRRAAHNNNRCIRRMRKSKSEGIATDIQEHRKQALQLVRLGEVRHGTFMWRGNAR